MNTIKRFPRCLPFVTLALSLCGGSTPPGPDPCGRLSMQGNLKAGMAVYAGGDNDVGENGKKQRYLYTIAKVVPDRDGKPETHFYIIRRANKQKDVWQTDAGDGKVNAALTVAPVPEALPKNLPDYPSQ